MNLTNEDYDIFVTKLSEFCALLESRGISVYGIVLSDQLFRDGQAVFTVLGVNFTFGGKDDK